MEMSMALLSKAKVLYCKNENINVTSLCYK